MLSLNTGGTLHSFSLLGRKSWQYFSFINYTFYNLFSLFLSLMSLSLAFQSVSFFIVSITSFSSNTLFFWNHFHEILTLLITHTIICVKLIIWDMKPLNNLISYVKIILSAFLIRPIALNSTESPIVNPLRVSLKKKSYLSRS